MLLFGEVLGFWFEFIWKVARLPKFGESLEGGAWRVHRPWFLPQLPWTPYEIKLDFWMQPMQSIIIF